MSDFWWGYLIWLILAIRLLGYARWLWQQGYRLGTVGLVIITGGTLAALLVANFSGSGLD